MENNKVRNSNMEILRIVAMVMIVIAHVVHNGVRHQLVDSSSIARLQNNLFANPEFYDRIFLVTGLLPIGNIGNAIFILISGYFMIEFGKSIKFGEISKKILLQLGFAVLLRMIVPLIYYGIYVPNKELIVNYGGINEFNSVYWFPGYYLFVIIIAGFFLNTKLLSLSQNTYKNMLWVIFGVISLTWTGGVLESLAKGLRTLVLGVFCTHWGDT